MRSLLQSDLISCPEQVYACSICSGVVDLLSVGQLLQSVCYACSSVLLAHHTLHL